MSTFVESPEGPVEPFTNETLISALKLVGWQGVAMLLETSDGQSYEVNAPIILGRDYVQFAPALGCAPVVIPFDEITAFQLL